MVVVTNTVLLSKIVYAHFNHVTAVVRYKQNDYRENELENKLFQSSYLIPFKILINFITFWLSHELLTLDLTKSIDSND